MNASFMSLAARIAAAAALLAGSALAADPSCKPLADAMTKVLTVPAHVYSTDIAEYTGGKPRNSEIIYLNDKTFVLVNGKWRTSPMTRDTVARMQKDAKANPDTHIISSCRIVRDEAVNGEAATVFSEHTETPDLKSDSQVWISKSRGLPLKLELDSEVGGGAAGKSHKTSRFEYTNVQAPSAVR
ncbi:MAG TPA: hypothetical protein VN736_13130 [Candidatus Limnocylindrales bacterium]|nr:hypothetical protein [Candidatus Limnocylindrales bacterium]